MKKPKIIKGICEFCGVPAEECSHYKTGKFVDVAKTDEHKVDLYKKLSNRERIADIVIPHHNRHDHLRECLERLPNDVFNIIIVSGGSFARNCNKGAMLAVTDNIIFLNDDTMPDPEVLLEACKMPEDIIGFSQIIPSNGDEILHGVGFGIKDGHWTAAATSKKEIIGIPFGFLFRVKTKVWQELGGFDEEFYNGGEDSDFFFRAIDQGYSIGYQDKPTIHKHSQSDGRLTFSKENQALLDKKWPNDKVINLLNINDINTIIDDGRRMKYKILVANNHLDNYAGSETWTYAMVKELERLGHEVDVWTLIPGKVSEMLNTIMGDTIMPQEYDLLIINHNSCLKGLGHINGYKIFTSHGIYPALEQPIEGADAYVSITPEVQTHLKKLGFESQIIYNGVDMDRFKSTSPVNPTLKNVLCMCKGPEAATLIKQACDELGVNFRWIEDFWNVEEEINKADLVFTLGRGALEAMSCEREVIILDSRAYMKMGIVGDGLIRTDDIQRVMHHNYSGRARNSNFTLSGLIEQMSQYNPAEGKKNREYVKIYHDIKTAAKMYLKLYENNRNNKSTERGEYN